MKITESKNYYLNNQNNIKQNKTISNPIQSLKADTVEFSYNKKQNNSINFTGFFWRKDNKETIPLDGETPVLSPKQLLNIQKNITAEVINIIKSEYTDAKAERLDKLLHSEFIDYKLESYQNNCSFSLEDLIIYHFEDNNNKLYNQFLATSLGETMPIEQYNNSENKDYKKKLQNLYMTNESVFLTLQSYLKMDESSKDAEKIRQMIKRLHDNDMNLPELENLFAECLLNNMPKMCKVLSEDIGIEPFDRVPIIKDERYKNYAEIYQQKPGTSNNVYNGIIYNSDQESSNFIVLYPKKSTTYISSDVITNLSLYKISGISDSKESKEFFDMPEYLYQSAQRKTKYDYWYTSYNSPYTPEINNFFWDNANHHPEIKTVEFLEKLITKFHNDDKDFDIYNEIGLRRSLFSEPEYYKDSLILIKKLQNDDSLEAQKRIKILKEIYQTSAYALDRGENSDEILNMLKYMDVEDLVSEKEMNSPEMKQKIRNNFEAYISNKYDIYDINNWIKILDEFEGSKNDSFEINFILNNLPDVFYNAANSKEYKNVIEKLNTIEGDWNITDTFGNNIAHRAVEAENPLLIEFAKDKKVDFTRKNNASKTAMDLIKDNRNSSIINSIKVNSDELINFAKKGLLSGIKILLTNPVIDINSVDENGDSAGIIASRKGDVQLIKLLNQKQDFNINYVNPKTLQSAFTAAKNSETMLALKENSNLNISQSDLSDYTEIFALLNNPDNSVEDIEKLLRKLSQNKDFNLEIIYNGSTLREKIKDYAFKKDVHKQAQIHDRLYANLQDGINKSFVNRARNIVDENGILSLAQIEDFINYPDILKIINEPLNEFNEPIGFFIADIPVTGDNISDIANIIDALKKYNYDFSIKNKMNQTLLEKSIDAENDFLTDYLQNLGVKR